MPDSFAAFTTAAKYAAEDGLLEWLVAEADLSAQDRRSISAEAEALVRQIRTEARPSLMEHFLSEYGLSSREGVALMCLAEAMLRVPDARTMDALIEDKIAPSDWGRHMGAAASSLVNASTWALMLTGRVLDDEQPGLAGVLRGAVKRLGEPVIRVAVGRAMKEMGRQFVLGETIEMAMRRAREEEAKGYTYSYDMLGEAAMTRTDAERYATRYGRAIKAIASSCTADSVAANPGISIKLSALHPRYEPSQQARVMADLVPRVIDLARQAKAAGMGFNIDAEEQARLVLSLRVIEAVLSDPSLAGWDGFGVVVQAYGKRAAQTIDWLTAIAERLDRRLMVRLVKGAYWDTEMKVSQVEGHPGFPLFTAKTATDVSFISLARRLFQTDGRLYPQFATHNAQTVAAVRAMAGNRAYEFQRLHGMGERLHDIVLAKPGGRCRIYAPVGAHRDLLAYLVRRLLENGANSSFVHQIVDASVPPSEIAEDPFEALKGAVPPVGLVEPASLFAPHRANSAGFDLSDDATLTRIDIARNKAERPAAPPKAASSQEVFDACARAQTWTASAAERAAILRTAARYYEEEFGAIFAILATEAGKTWLDAVGELREAVDFLYYYAAEAERTRPDPRGIFAAISPWNFPLAIFTGQIAAALAAGNGVIAKPAEQTPRIAAFAVDLLHRAGVPSSALQLLAGDGASVGAALTRASEVDGVVFTGSTETAFRIRRAMAETLAPGAPLIAETGGLNAMIVDSTALPEQAVRDILASAFQSAGQRCSALRCLYLQEDVATEFIDMLIGAMDQLVVGDPWDLTTDIGPVIDTEAQRDILAYIESARDDGRVRHQVDTPDDGCFVPPTLITVSRIEDLPREIFGPVLHIATFRSEDLTQVIDAVNAKGYGLTFGLHTRIDSRVQEIADAVHAGNIYVNRNQIGAVVGSQPFGGEGLSGTGPKAGGPSYLPRFAKPRAAEAPGSWSQLADVARIKDRLIQARPKVIGQRSLPGPTGEANTLTCLQRGPILCLGPGADAQAAQIAAVEALGGLAVGADGALRAADLDEMPGLAAVITWASDARDLARALAERPGPIVPLITAYPDQGHVQHERHLCIDTTAAGGNATLLAG